MRHCLTLLLLCIMCTAATTQAQAASWPSLAAACMPERAEKWQPGLAESAQPACHCPPAETCPTDYRSYYSDYPNTLMPPALLYRCCTQPLCPSGTHYEGKPIPQDGNCDPTCPGGNCAELCPIGTSLAGVTMPHDRECNRCPEGTTYAGQVREPGTCTELTCATSMGKSCPPPPVNQSCTDACGEEKRHGRKWCEYGYSYGGASPLRTLLQCKNGIIVDLGAISGIGCDSAGGPVNCQ